VRLREAAVVEAVTWYMSQRGYDVLGEYPILGKVADIYGLHPAEGRSVAVECKERDWRRGLEQARRYRAAADDVFLALPLRAVTEEVAQRAHTIGIGIITVDDTSGVDILLEADKISTSIPELQQRTRQQFAHRQANND
jgi:hypothetical protein